MPSVLQRQRERQHFRGYDANGAAGITNATAIGANASVTQSNSLVLGSRGVFNVNVGIGTSAPKTKLHVTSGKIYVTTVLSLPA